jgi:hypothetical protein
VSNSKSLMDGPVPVVEAQIGQMLGCDWKGEEQLRTCTHVVSYDGPLPNGAIVSGYGLDTTPISVDIMLTSNHAAIEAVQLVALAASDADPPPRNPEVTVGYVRKIVQYLLPDWPEGPEWIARAVRAAGTKFDTEVATGIARVGEYLILVRSRHPVDGAEKYAEVIITRKDRFDEWMVYPE